MTACSFATVGEVGSLMPIPLDVCAQMDIDISVKATCDGVVAFNNAGCSGTGVDFAIATADDEDGVEAEVHNCPNTPCDHFQMKHSDEDDNGVETECQDTSSWIPVALDAVWEWRMMATPTF